MIARRWPVVVTGCLIMATGCTVASSHPSPSDGSSEMGSGSRSPGMVPLESSLNSPDAPLSDVGAETAAPALPEMSGSSIASVTVGEPGVEGRTGEAKADRSYLVRGACLHAETISYAVSVEDDGVVSGTINCGTEMISTAFTGKSGLVSLETPDVPVGAVGFVEIIEG